MKTPSPYYLPSGFVLVGNLVDMMNENPLWKWNICDNNCKDHFMETVFANSSVLWAYNMLNPEVGDKIVPMALTGLIII
jgi:hypothetical protein